MVLPWPKRIISASQACNYKWSCLLLSKRTDLCVFAYVSYPALVTWETDGSHTDQLSFFFFFFFCVRALRTRTIRFSFTVSLVFEHLTHRLLSEWDEILEKTIKDKVLVIMTVPKLICKKSKQLWKKKKYRLMWKATGKRSNTAWKSPSKICIVQYRKKT